MKNKKHLIMVIISLVIILGLGITLYIISPIVSLKKEIKVSVNDNIETKKFIDHIYLGKILNATVDTSKLGRQQIEIQIKSLFGDIKSYKSTIEVIDKEAPIIEARDELSIYQNENFDLLNLVRVTDNYDKNLKVTIIGKYDLGVVGEYQLKFYAKDTSSNETYKNFLLKVQEKPQDIVVERTTKGYEIENRDGVTYINNILVANKTYTLPETYGNGLTKETENAFLKMQAAAKEKGLNIFIKSGFRSYKDQIIVYNNWVRKDGKKVADTYSARAGHSEHQSGLAIDINSISKSFETTDEFSWLQFNAYKYGFILRYPKKKEEITGYIYEPWHYRYVGEDLARELYNNGNWLTLEEYLGIDSKYQ